MGGLVKMNMLWTLLSFPLGLLSLYFYLFKRKPKIDLKDKVVFISGVSSGLGKALAEVFFSCECKVILAGRKKESLLGVKDELLENKNDRAGDVGIVVLDLEDLSGIPDKMKEAMSVFGRIDILVNNAGMSYRGKAWETKLEVDQQLMNVNFFGHIQVTRAVLPHMMQRRSGHIVAIGSIQSLVGIPNRTAYAASKHALAGWFESLRANLSSHNVDVCTIEPAYIKTNLSLNAVCSDGMKYGKMDQKTSKGMEPSDVAAKIVDCVINRVENKVISPIHIHLLVILRTMAPSLFFKLMERTARAELNGKKKNS